MRYPSHVCRIRSCHLTEETQPSLWEVTVVELKKTSQQLIKTNTLSGAHLSVSYESYSDTNTNDAKIYFFKTFFSFKTD